MLNKAISGHPISQIVIDNQRRLSSARAWAIWQPLAPFNPGPQRFGPGKRTTWKAFSLIAG